jgi:phage shock protein PspC (stress-responsive transcriptional regulator)
MKRAIKINLAGEFFDIDDDAFEKFDRYLKSIEHHFRYSTGKVEIMEDIEARIAELFLERLGKERQVINITDVEEIISLLGRPEDMREPGDESHYESSTIEPQVVGKRLYRDVDDRILGGVCSGIAKYFNIDPWIVRGIFIAATLLAASGFLVYIILWIIIPPAESTIQKMEMRGEKINLSNIEDTVKREFEEIKRSFKNMKI